MPRLVVHGHYYQPPRENPWSEELSREASAAPFQNWNERICAECYRPNTAARILDDQGRIEDIVNIFELVSFDLGPTLEQWMAREEPGVLQAIVDADAKTEHGIAHPFHHIILPLASERDVRTEIRWGLASWKARFGRTPIAMWAPETALDNRTCRLLAEEGVQAVVVAPHQISAVRHPEQDWREVGSVPLDEGAVWRWTDEDNAEFTLKVIAYEGGLSHELAFSMAHLTSQDLLNQVLGTGREVVAVATDGETFGHHSRWGERLIAHALGRAAAELGIEVVGIEQLLQDSEPSGEVRLRPSAWSCAHGLERWRDDCGCTTGGEPGWTQQWRRPLRESLELLRDACERLFEETGKQCLRDPWVARDAYIDVLLNPLKRDEFARTHVIGDASLAFGLLEMQRCSLAMFTSCGWFFEDLARPETVQILRYAARALQLFEDVSSSSSPREEFLLLLEKGRSNDSDEGTGRDIWNRDVESAKVTPARVVADVALTELLERLRPPTRRAMWDLHLLQHREAERGALRMCAGVVEVIDRRTLVQTAHAYAAVVIGAVEVYGALRAADPARDAISLQLVEDAFNGGMSLPAILRLVAEQFGPDEFGLEDMLPDASERILKRAADDLADRFAGSAERLVDDHEDVLDALARHGYPLPDVLHDPLRSSLYRRLERSIAAKNYDESQRLADRLEEASMLGDHPGLSLLLSTELEKAVRAVIAEGGAGPASEAFAIISLVEQLRLAVRMAPTQEALHDALRLTNNAPLRLLAERLQLVAP